MLGLVSKLSLEMKFNFLPRVIITQIIYFFQNLVQVKTRFRNFKQQDNIVSKTITTLWLREIIDASSRMPTLTRTWVLSQISGYSACVRSKSVVSPCITSFLAWKDNCEYYNYILQFKFQYKNYKNWGWINYVSWTELYVYLLDRQKSILS